MQLTPETLWGLVLNAQEVIDCERETKALRTQLEEIAKEFGGVTETHINTTPWGKVHPKLDVELRITSAEADGKITTIRVEIRRAPDLEPNRVLSSLIGMPIVKGDEDNVSFFDSDGLVKVRKVMTSLREDLARQKAYQAGLADDANRLTDNRQVLLQADRKE